MAAKPRLYSRAERPEDLPPIISDVYKIWQTSNMHLTVIAEQIGVSRGALYGWLQGKGSPLLDRIEGMLNLLGYHLAVVPDYSSAGRSARKAALANKPAAPTGTERAQRPDDLSPLVLRTYELVREFGTPIRVVARHVGVSESTLYGWFMGQGTPNVVTIDNLLRLHGYRLKAERGVHVTVRANHAGTSS